MESTQKENQEKELIYIDHKLCCHNGLYYCNKCCHRKIFEDNNIPYKILESETNNIKTTYTFLIY